MINQYTIQQLASPQNELVNNLTTTDIDWLTIDALNINCYPWYQSGKKQNTTIKICANTEALFIQVVAQDNYSSAIQTELNHMLICEDSCFEFFFSPSGVLGSSYVNLEVNCCGALHMAYGMNRENRQFISCDIANQITCKSSITSPTKTHQTYAKNNKDENWKIEIKIPFSVIKKITGETINTERWFANFYRCGGNIEPQYASWNHIDVSNPDYHQPKFFGELVFN